jgi:3-oxoacyl-[acyl-carrier-protein] synthase-3
MLQFNTQVESVGHFVPSKVVTNDDLSKVMDTSDKWIQERTGIKERRAAPIEMGTSDLGVAAAKEALDRAGTSLELGDLILAATLSPDYYFPGIGVQIQHKLGAPTIPALDIRGQCSGFSWGVSTADAFIRSGQYKRVLLVGAELQTRVIEFSTQARNVSVLFGDGAGALLLSRSDGEAASIDNQKRGVIDNMMASDGSGAELLIVKRPGISAGCETILSEEEVRNKAYLPYMNGPQVFRHAVTRMIEACQTLLTRNGLNPTDIDLLIPHQANLRINETVREKLGLPINKVFNNIHRYGNTTAATIPLAMYEAEAEGRLKQGDLLLTVAFGSGFTWGANLIRW